MDCYKRTGLSDSQRRPPNSGPLCVTNPYFKPRPHNFSTRYPPPEVVADLPHSLPHASHLRMSAMPFLHQRLQRPRLDVYHHPNSCISRLIPSRPRSAQAEQPCTYTSHSASSRAESYRLWTSEPRLKLNSKHIVMEHDTPPRPLPGEAASISTIDTSPRRNRRVGCVSSAPVFCVVVLLCI